MYANLVIGFDGSAAGRDAVALARRLALATGAAVTVLYARSYTALTADAHETGESLPWREAAELVLDEARKMLTDVPDVIYRAVAERSAARALHSAADTVKASLIVIGSTHRSGVGRLAPGTTSRPDPVRGAVRGRRGAVGLRGWRARRGAADRGRRRRRRRRERPRRAPRGYHRAARRRDDPPCHRRRAAHPDRGAVHGRHRVRALR